MSVQVKFSVDVDTRSGQHVCLVGSDPRMGSWDPLRAVVMERHFSGQNWKQWSCLVDLRVASTYSYRFFVCKDHRVATKSVSTPWQLDSNGDTANTHPLTVYKWETNIRPRHLDTSGCGPYLELPVATFGKYDGLSSSGKGWLINQCEVQLRLHSNPIYMWKSKHREQSYSIKCVAMDYSLQGGVPLDDEDDSRDGPPPCSVDDLLVSNLGHADCQPEVQGPAGMLYNKDDYIIFRSQMPDPQLQGFQLDFFVCETKRAPKFVGSSHLLPFKQPDSQHKRKVPIIGCNHKPIGEIMVEYLIVRPVPGLSMTMEMCYQFYWKWKAKGKKPLDIGHRGMGSSYSQVSSLKENTVASFAAAGKHGAEFVEFDVVLCKDKIPVIFHDFAVKASYSTVTKMQHKVQSQLFEIPVKCLTLDQLQSMRLYSSGPHDAEIHNDGGDVGEGANNVEPFPTLETVLKDVPEEIGFDVEIKFPMQDENDKWEEENYFDINENLDHILRVIFAHAGHRKIVFSTFDPDTCTLLQLKQNRYPVLFLHQGQTDIYTRYKDYRASTFKNGISFALAERLLGLALHSEVLLRDLDLIERVSQKNLVLFVWGNDNNDPKMIRRLRDLQVDGIIYDRIDCHKPENHEPEFELPSETVAASFNTVVNREEGASVHYCDISNNQLTHDSQMMSQ